MTTFFQGVVIIADLAGYHCKAFRTVTAKSQSLLLSDRCFLYLKKFYLNLLSLFSPGNIHTYIITV